MFMTMTSPKLIAMDRPSSMSRFGSAMKSARIGLYEKIVESRRYADHVRAWAAAEIRRAERDEQFFLTRFGGELENWCRQQIAKNGGKRRSLNLPAGRIGIRARRAGLNLVDSPALLAWCRANLPDAIAITERIAKTPLQTFLEATGELPAGTEIIPAADHFYVERPAPA